MKRQHLVLMIVGCALVLILLIFGRRLADREAGQSPGTASSGEQATLTGVGTSPGTGTGTGTGTGATGAELPGVPGATATTGTAGTTATTVSGLTTEPAATTGEPPRRYTLKPEGELATVNGVAIRAEDLMPDDQLRRDGSVSLSAEEFKVLLARAIDRELVFQQANAQELKLTKQQEMMLGALEGRLQAREYEPPVKTLGGQPISNATVVVGGPGYVDFAVRERRALELEKSLVLQAGIARSDYMAQLRSAADIQYNVEVP